MYELIDEEIKSEDSESEKLQDRIIVDEAINGKEALEKFEKMFMKSKCTNPTCKLSCYRLIIMDLNMPIMDGFQATEEILSMYKNNPNFIKQGCPPVNIVALTSYTDLKTLNRCHEIGIKKVFHKPLKSDEIKKIICNYHFGMTEEQLNSYLE